MSPQAVLDPLPIDRTAKAAAWDAVHSTQTPEDLQSKMDDLPLPKAAKAALWDVKSSLWDQNPDAHFQGTPPPEAQPEAAPTEPLQPVNTNDFLKAHGVWHKATTNAAAKVMSDNPGMAWEDAQKAVAGTTGKEPKIDDFKAIPEPPPAPPEPEAPPEPPKPDKVQKVGPATPNPPTAAVATTPESPETIALQLDQMTKGIRKVVMFPKGVGQPLSPPPGLSLANDGMGNTYLFRPDLINRSAIRQAAKNNTLPEILGGPMGMGAPDKSALQGPPVAVVAKSPEGIEAQTTATDAQNMPQTLLATHAVMPEGGTLEVRPPEGALNDRLSQKPGEVIQNLPPVNAGVGPAIPAVNLRNLLTTARQSGLDLNRFDVRSIQGRRLLQGAINGRKDNASGAIPGAVDRGNTQIPYAVPHLSEGRQPIAVRGRIRPPDSGTDAGQPKPNAWGAVYGPVRKVTGSADIPLSLEGHAQVQDLARKAVEPFDVVYHAPNERATQTAQAFAGKSKLPPVTLPSLGGWARGAYEGQDADAVKPQMGALIANPDQAPPGKSPISGQPGQSWNQMAKPLFSDVSNVAGNLHPGERALMLTSGGNLQAIDAWGKAGYPESGDFDRSELVKQPYWSVTGKMFRLGPAGLDEVPDNSDSGLMLAEHGQTAFNSKSAASGMKLPEALKMYDTADPVLRRQIHRVVRDKTFAAREKPEIWDGPSKMLAKKHFGVIPITKLQT